MFNYRVRFEDIAWASPAAGVRFKAVQMEGRRLRLVEFSSEFVEAEWCRQGHIGMILDGRMRIDFADSSVDYGAGDGVFIPAGYPHRHKAALLSGPVRAILAEDVAPDRSSQPMPTLTTQRLVLRPFKLDDAKTLQRLMGSWKIADTTLSIPHPYEDGVAEAWISTHQERFDSGRNLDLAITLRASGELIGGIGLTIAPQHARGELGYCLGVEFWNRGYATEAAAAIVRHGFEHLGLERIMGEHFSRNPASGRVMQKIGMRHEGTLRRHVRKWDKFEDVEVYGILKDQLQ